MKKKVFCFNMLLEYVNDLNPVLTDRLLFRFSFGSTIETEFEKRFKKVGTDKAPESVLKKQEMQE